MTMLTTRAHFLLVACATHSLSCAQPSRVTAPVPEEGKPSAPVALNADLSGNLARITLSFESAATDVKVSAWGVDGLAVRGNSTLLDGATVGKGESRTFEVGYAPGPGRSHLAVSVGGMFGGTKLERVVTFGVGSVSDDQRKGAGETITTGDGQRIKVMPTESK